jgi:acyl dehydratase
MTPSVASTSGQPDRQPDTLFTRTVHLTRDDLRRYAAASGDANPIHADDEAARSVGLPGVVAHGMLTLGLAMTAVADWAGSADALTEFGARFVKPVPVDARTGAELVITGTRGSDGDAGSTRVDVTVTCAGTKVLGMARAVVRAGTDRPA